MSSPFGVRLREWRAHRGLSQLELASRSGSTPRHVSFLETGRSRPSQQMVLRLADVLDLSLRDRNELLRTAGLAPAYREADLDGPDLASYRAMVADLLAAHEPYPATVVDARWNVLAANAASRLLLGDDVVGSNIVRRFVAAPEAQTRLANWPDVAWATAHRLRQELARAPFDHELADLVAVTDRALAGRVLPQEPSPSLVICPWFRIGDEVVRTVGMVARFEPVNEVTLDELRVELTYPQDEFAERFFRTAAESSREGSAAASIGPNQTGPGAGA